MPYFGRTFQPMFNCVCFPRAYLIISFDLTNVISLFTWLWKSIFLEISRNCHWVHQPPPHPLLGLLMNSCFGTRFHSSFPENLTMSSRQFVSHLLFSGTLSLRYPDTNQIWISVRYDGWNIFSRVITLILIWPGKVMSCLAHLAGGPIALVSFIARLTILP